MIELNDRKGDGLHWPHGESWCIGDQPTVSLLLEDRECVNYTLKIAPRVTSDYRYIPQSSNRLIRVYHTIDVRMTMEDFYAKLQLFFPPQPFMWR